MDVLSFLRAEQRLVKLIQGDIDLNYIILLMFDEIADYKTEGAAVCQCECQCDGGLLAGSPWGPRLAEHPCKARLVWHESHSSNAANYVLNRAKGAQINKNAVTVCIMLTY